MAPEITLVSYPNSNPPNAAATAITSAYARFRSLKGVSFAIRKVLQSKIQPSKRHRLYSFHGRPAGQYHSEWGHRLQRPTRSLPQDCADTVPFTIACVRHFRDKGRVQETANPAHK